MFAGNEDMLLFSVDKVDITLEMKQWAEKAALSRAAYSACFPFSVWHPPYPHCTAQSRHDLECEVKKMHAK